MHTYKRLALIALAGLLFINAPTAAASAAEISTEEVAENTEETSESLESDTEESSEVSENNTEETLKVSKDKKKNKKEDVSEQPEKAAYKEKTLTITKEGFVADSFNGVDALYRKGRSDGSSSTYSCAAYIKRYYKEVHGVSVNNLFGGRTPMSSKGTFKLVKTPQAGDVVACHSTGGSNHWAIVKQVNDDNTVTLIEQNWKWSQGGQTVCKSNRSISFSSGKFYRLYE